jgi:lipid-binding SYLF domain-containing protein
MHLAPRLISFVLHFPANHVLEQALKPGIQGLPKNLFEDCLGVVMVSIIEAGFIFSANVGTGIVLLKQADGTFSQSAPCAVGLTGVGFGLLAGASVKDVVCCHSRDLLVFVFANAVF